MLNICLLLFSDLKFSSSHPQPIGFRGNLLVTSNPQPIGFRGNLLVKRQKFFYCTYSLGITETS